LSASHLADNVDSVDRHEFHQEAKKIAAHLADAAAANEAHIGRAVLDSSAVELGGQGYHGVGVV
jgi:hypothetical protein